MQFPFQLLWKVGVLLSRARQSEALLDSHVNRLRKLPHRQHPTARHIHGSSAPPQRRVMAPIGMDDRIFAVAAIDASHRPTDGILLEIGKGPVDHKKAAAAYACHSVPPSDFRVL
jgi:hypothetical protein